MTGRFGALVAIAAETIPALLNEAGPVGPRPAPGPEGVVWGYSWVSRNRMSPEDE